MEEFEGRVKNLEKKVKSWKPKKVKPKSKIDLVRECQRGGSSFKLICLGFRV